jgi:hypothetical protein
MDNRDDGLVLVNLDGDDTPETGFRIPYPAGMAPRGDRRFVDFSDTEAS